MKGSILIVEDSPTFADMMALRLSSAFSGYDILCANSLQQGIALISQFRFDLILSDLNVGDSNGLDTAIRIREVTAVPIVLYSALLREQSAIEQAIELGFQDLFVKGETSSAELIERIHCLLATRQLPDETNATDEANAPSRVAGQRVSP